MGWGDGFGEACEMGRDGLKKCIAGLLTRKKCIESGPG
jgi:hypothetical protein